MNPPPPSNIDSAREKIKKMQEEKERVKGLKVLILTNKGWFEVEMRENDKYRVFKIIDEKKITLKTTK